MAALRYGFGINPASTDDVVRSVGEADTLDFHRVGIWDSPALYREVWMSLAAVARNTRCIRLGPWVTNPLTRHPVVTASAAATLDELAPGRVVLGIGTGDSGVYNLGGTASPLTVLCEYIRAVRSLLENGEAEWRGKSLSMPWGGGRSIPIWASAHGTRSLRAVAGIADGVIVGLGVSPEIIGQCRTILSEAADEMGRDPNDIETWWMAPWYVDEDSDAARASGLWHVASLVHHWSRTSTYGKLLPTEYRDAVLALGSRYDLATHGIPTDEQKRDYARLATQLGLADYLLSRFTFSGTPREVAEQVRAAFRAGATNLDCANPAAPGHIMDRPRRWANSVVPLLTDLIGGSSVEGASGPTETGGRLT